MIHSNDRSYYIGASDTDYVMRSWTTRTFERWWLIKQGYITDDIKTDAMLAGTYYEHRILDALDIPGMEKDRQIIKGRLRVNLDGCTNDTIYEVKTHRADKPFSVPTGYRRQVNVEMYAFGIRNAYIVAYGLTDEDYKNFYNEIDMLRLQLFPIAYGPEFILKYEARMFYLSDCLRLGKFPREEELHEIYGQA